jgi:hypothetical protein
MTVWRMRIAYWITQATDTHSEYVILIPFALEQRLQERALLLCHTYSPLPVFFLLVSVLCFLLHKAYTYFWMLCYGWPGRTRCFARPCEICGGQSGGGTGLSPSVSIMPPMHHARLYLNVALNRKTNERNLWRKQCSVRYRETLAGKSLL